MKDRFLFFENFRQMADCLPDDMQLKFYKSLMSYVFDDVEPDDPVIKSLITAIKPSLNKEEKRGGNHNPTGQNQHNKTEKKNNEVKVGQNNNGLGQSEVKVGQSGQSFLETETGNGNKKQETEILSSDKSSESINLRPPVGEKNEKVPKNASYAFAGKVIRLTQADFDRWQRAYPDLNLWGELMLRDDWLAEQPPDEQKRWFMSTSQYFIKQNEKRKKQNAEFGEFENEPKGGRNEKKEHDWSWV